MSKTYNHAVTYNHASVDDNFRKNDSKNKSGLKEDDDATIHSTRFKSLKNNYHDPLTKVYLQLYIRDLPLFTKFNLFLRDLFPQWQLKFLSLLLLRAYWLHSDIGEEKLELPLKETRMGVFAKCFFDVMLIESDKWTEKSLRFKYLVLLWQLSRKASSIYYKIPLSNYFGKQLFRPLNMGQLLTVRFWL